LPTPHVRVPRHVARLVARLLRFEQVHHAARCRLLRLRRASGCLGTSRGSSSTTSTTPRIKVPRHIAWLITRLVTPLVVDYSASCRLVVDYFASAARPGASACRAARHAARRADCRRLLRLTQARCRLLRLKQARRRLLRLCRAFGCLGTSRCSLSTTSTTPCIRLLRHVTRLVVDYSASRRLVVD
jgi:hypothetical protein